MLRDPRQGSPHSLLLNISGQKPLPHNPNPGIMQTRNHITHTLPAGRLNLSSWGSESVSVTDHVGDQVSIIGVSDANLRDAITSYVRGLRHVSTSDKAAAAAWLALLADSVSETADRLKEVTA